MERDAVLPAADLAGAAGPMIAMENLNPNRTMMAGMMTSYALDPRALADHAAEAGRVIAAIGHPAVGGTLDFGHGWLAAGRLGFDTIAAILELAGRHEIELEPTLAHVAGLMARLNATAPRG